MGSFLRLKKYYVSRMAVAEAAAIRLFIIA